MLLAQQCKQMIDIIIPVYEARKFLNRALDSIKKQTISNLIYVTIVDDGSKEKYDDILKKYTLALNIQLIKLPKNKGQGYAKQYGIKKTENPYLFFMDADDILINNKALELLLNEMLQNNYDIVAGKELINNKVLIHEGHMVAKLLNRKFILKNKIKVPNYPIEEDVAFIMNAYCFSSKEKTKNIKEVIYKYCRRNKNSITSKYSIDKGYDYKYFFKSINYVYYSLKNPRKNQYFNNRLALILLGLSQAYIKYYQKAELNTKECFLKNCKCFFQKYIYYYKNIEIIIQIKFTKEESNIIKYFQNILKNY